ncbi:MAG: poly(R)-hydroxyalkanoic acid synthase subunit PhaE [Pseudomonadota bacterium]
MDKNSTGGDQGYASMDWSKTMQQNWQYLFDAYRIVSQVPGAGGQNDLNKGRVKESLTTSTKFWQSILAAMGEPSTFEQFQKLTALMPQITTGFTQACVQSYTKIQAQAGEWIQKRGTALSTKDIQELDSELIKDLIQIYQNEFKKYFNVPQIGLNRLQQERILHAADKSNSFQFVLSEFLHMLYLPIEKSFQSLQEKIVEMTEIGTLEEKSKTYYNLWIKLLEGKYMELFKQPEYVEKLTATLSALNEFARARQTVINDGLKQFHIPSYQDIDELSKEIYHLKKRFRAFEKNNSQNPV